MCAVSDAPNDRDRDLTARALPAEIVGLPTQLHAIGAAMTEIRMELGSLRSVDDRLDRMEELITAIGRQLNQDAETQRLLASTLAELDQRVQSEGSGRSDAAAGETEQRLARIEDTVGHLAESIEPLSNAVYATQDRVALVVSSGESLARAINAIGATLQPGDAGPPFDPSALTVEVLSGTEAALTRALDALSTSLRDDQDARFAALTETITSDDTRPAGPGTDHLDVAIGKATAATADLAVRLEGALDELAGQIAVDVVTAISEPLRQVAMDAATQAGVAVAEGSIAAAEVASEAILAEQEVKIAHLADMISRVQEVVGSRADATQASIEALTPAVDRLVRQLDQIRRTTAAESDLGPTLRQIEASIQAFQSRAGEDEDRLEAGITAGVVAASREAVESTGQMVIASALASFERTAMTTQSDLERATDAALDALLAAVDARLTGAVLSGEDALAESIGNLFANAQLAFDGQLTGSTRGPDPAEIARTASRAAVTAALTYATDAVPETARSVAELVAVHLEGATTDAVRAAVVEAVDAAVEASISPALRAAGQSIAIAVTDAVTDATAETAGQTAVDTDAIVAATTETVSEAMTAMEETVRQAISIRSVQATRPPEGQEIAAAMMTAVAESLNELGTNVQADLDAMNSRLAALAAVLEALVEETAARRRGPRTGTLDLLRQVAAEAPDAPKPRRGPANRPRPAKTAGAKQKAAADRPAEAEPTP